MNVAAIVIGLVCAAVITLVFRAKSLTAWLVNLLAGAVGALALSQMMVFGPMFWGIYLLPSIVGSVVLVLVTTFIVTRVIK